MDKVVHFEIPAEDLPRAKKFYSSVFGWKTEDVPDIEYTMVHTVAVDKETRMPKEPGAINGGMMKRMPAIKSPVITINVDDIDKAMQKVVKAGGKVIVEKQKVMDMGWNAYVQDTEGNIIGVWQSTRKM
ncbi:MAG: VOC family protein [Candidatus Micrarchaeota archaeon]|nr:VOC family protein [Candidatus Micrarchaeota archaeon]